VRPTRGRIGTSGRRLACLDGQQQASGEMALNQWQHNFLRRLVELGGSISVPDGVINEELIELLEAGYVLEGSGGPGRTRYKITEAGRAAATQSVGE
jgi:hypothetical protein